MLKFFDLYKFKTIKLVHDYMNSKLPLSSPIDDDDDDDDDILFMLSNNI